MKKKFKEMFEFVKKEETESGAVGLREHGLFLQDVSKVAKKYGFDCYCKAYPKEKIDYVPTGKEYEIKTVEDIAKLTAEQFEFFIEDLRNFCNVQRELQAVDELLPGVIKKESSGFTWLDT